MSSPKPGNVFSKRSLRIGTSAAVSCDEKVNAQPRWSFCFPDAVPGKRRSAVHGFRLSTPSLTARALHIRRARNNEHAHVGAGRHSHAVQVSHRIQRALLHVVESLYRAQRIQCRAKKPAPAITPVALTAMPFAFEKRLAAAVGRWSRRRHSSDTDGPAAPASSSASVGSRFSANCLMFQSPSVVMNAPAGTVFARAEACLHVRDRSRGFKPNIMPGPHSQQHDVVVIVDQSRNHRAAPQINDLRAGRTRAFPPSPPCRTRPF